MTSTVLEAAFEDYFEAGRLSNAENGRAASFPLLK
jgi:hypothetical protein